MTKTFLSVPVPENAPISLEQIETGAIPFTAAKGTRQARGQLRQWLRDNGWLSSTVKSLNKAQFMDILRISEGREPKGLPLEPIQPREPQEAETLATLPAETETPQKAAQVATVTNGTGSQLAALVTQQAQLIADLAHLPQNDDEIISRAREILRERSNRYTEALTSPALVRRSLSDWFTGCEREEFVCAFLDSQHRVIKTETLFQGTINAAPVYPREIVKRALELNSAALIVAHNHPSGVTEPSQADIRVTQRIKEALSTVDISLLDHFIVDPQGVAEMCCFSERGLL